MPLAVNEPTTVKAKSIFTSKTFWVNAAVAVVMMGGHLLNVMPDNIDAYILPVVAVANIVLRFLTEAPIATE